jgi:hypothetical protein
VVKIQIPIGGNMYTEMSVAIDYRGWVAPEEKVKRCSACMTVFGKEIRNGELLDTGLALCDVFTGQCRKCGYPLSWYVTDRLMRSIAERIKAR